MGFTITLVILCIITSAAVIVSIILFFRYISLKKIHTSYSEWLERKNEFGTTLPEKIQISKRQLETVFDAIPDCICIIDRNMRIVRVNKSYAQFIGIPIKKILGGTCYHHFWKKEMSCEDCPARSTLLSGKPILNKPIRYVVGDEIRHFEISTSPVFAEDGTTIHVIEYIRETTEQKRMLEQLIRSEKLASIGIMTAGIAHEINNPLSGISGTAANMLEKPEKYGLNEKGVTRISTILEAAGRATSIMKDLLHLSRRQESTRTLININSLIEKTINAIHVPGALDVERRFGFDPSIPPITCDASKIEQVIINVVTNAFQSIVEKKVQISSESRSFHGMILVSTALQDSQVLITVTDNGIGIPVKIRSKVFDPFFSTRPTGQGTGLGLSICHRIIEEHGGKIFFDCLDDFTVFSIVLPLEQVTPRNHFVNTTATE